MGVGSAVVGFNSVVGASVVASGAAVVGTVVGKGGAKNKNAETVY